MKKLLRQIYYFNLQKYLHDRLVLFHFRRCQKILDVGCGTGGFISYDPNRITGLDANRQTVNHCRSLGYQVKQGQATRLPFPANSFDGLYSSHLIEHLQPQQAYRFLVQASRVLKPKGILIIRAPLLWPHFFDNLSHIKPYPPRAICRYLVEDAPDTSFKKIRHKFAPMAVYYRYYSFFRKNGYTLVLKKLS